MARNRKRAKDRRARRPEPIAAPRMNNEPELPASLEHAAPDVELAEIQLEVGRPAAADDEELEPADEFDEQDAEVEAEFDDSDELAEPAAGGSGSGFARGGFNGGGGEERGGELAAPGPAPVARQRTGLRLIGFLQGSWNELQRVQWPDRRQVLQATGVVIGFVIVAGVFLGLADLVASKLVTFIIGH